MLRSVVFMILVFLLPLLCFQLKAQSVTKTTYFEENKNKIKEIFTLKDDQSGILEGKYISYYFNGEIESEGMFYENEPAGDWIFYYRDGSVRMKMTVQEDGSGYWKYFYENGVKSMEGKIKDGKREGEWKIYYESGELKYEGSFSNNMMQGKWSYYYEDETLRGTTNYSNNKGMATEYFTTGEIKSRGEKFGFTNSGDWTYYYKSTNSPQKVKAKGKYINGKRSGEWIYYFESGAISSKGSFLSGEPHGDWTYFYEKGAVSSTGSYADGLRNGGWDYFYLNGLKMGEAKFVNGSGPYKEYYPNGSLKIKGQYKKNKKFGRWEYFDKNDQLQAVCEYDNGIGYYKEFYPGTEDVKTAGNMQDGRKIGTWEIYDKEGKLTGYYKPFYNNTVVESDSSDPLPPADKMNTDPSYSMEKKNKVPYFMTKPGEFNGLIFGANPLFLFVGNFPISVEFYIEDRLGHEFEFDVIRDPFFTSDSDIPQNETYRRGYFISLRQKFYNTTDNPGLWYFGHEIQFSNISYNSNVTLPSLPDQVVKINANEQSVNYHLIFGYRLMGYTDKPGLSIDAFTGLGLGYRYYTVQDEYREYFEIPTNRFPVSFRFGFNIGYIFPFGDRYR